MVQAAASTRVTVGAAVLSLLLSGCAQRVEVAAATRASSAECAEVAARWPQRVADRERVAVRDEPSGVAAWGDPAIIARCGVAPPGPTTVECLAVDDVDWLVEPLSDGSRFTTFGRSPALEVLVPRDYAPEPLVLGAFTTTADQLPRTDLRCR